MMWWGHGGWGASAWVTMALTMLVLWGLVAALVVWIMRSVSSDRATLGDAGRTPPSPDSVLADRFARGEIDESEFIRRRDALHGSRGEPREP
ncbi:hypothetical protein ASD16_07665 [Cellulomonas sp. Root485]|nr:hypothetical protein ASD16_07665 [Cellulomonas sp. Root485]